MPLRARSLLVIAGCALVSIPASSTLAQDQTPPVPAVQPALSDRLTVRTKGRVTAPADEVELEFVVEGDSEDAKTAEKRHRDRLDRVLAALTGKEVEKASDDDEEGGHKRHKKNKEKGDDDDSSDSKEEKPKAALPEVGVPDKDGVVFLVREGRSTIGLLTNQNNNYSDDMPPEKKNEAANVGVGTAVHATFKNVSKVSAKKLRKLLAAALDKAAEGGACMGSVKTPVRPAIRFRPKEPEALAKKAYEDAVAKGRARAADIAKAAGRQLGKLTVMTELDPLQQQPQNQTDGLQAFEGLIQTGDVLPGDATGGSTEVQVEVALQLEFELK
ncbi:SIMPL domain-containing protein [bacterium]|nr:SIMPL domain-containing protein [bacterium]